MAKARLTDKQRSFINHYLQCWNAAEAARRAGYSEKTARNIGYENLTKPHLREVIEERMKSNAMSADETLARLSDQARVDMGDFLDVRHSYAKVDLARAKEQGLLRHIRKFKTTVGGGEIELYSSQTALQTLAKAQGLLHDKIEININIDLVVKAWTELEEAGLSPATAFQELINLARAERQRTEVEADSA